LFRVASVQIVHAIVPAIVHGHTFVY
jgi:hypothetical protein